MNIDPRNNASHLYAQSLTKQNEVGQARQAAEAKGSHASASDTLEINALDRLRSTPEVRPEVVAKGKELLNDPSYPSQELVHEMAKLIVPFDDEE